jgi:hypothetical protein
MGLGLVDGLGCSGDGRGCVGGCWTLGLASRGVGSGRLAAIVDALSILFTCGGDLLAMVLDGATVVGGALGVTVVGRN